VPEIVLAADRRAGARTGRRHMEPRLKGNLSKSEQISRATSLPRAGTPRLVKMHESTYSE